jgi:leader peptidase (prepilin peptidase)/N-methyltransferase
VIGFVAGLVLGVLGSWLADVLPRRYGITHVAARGTRRARNGILLALSAVIGAGIMEVLLSTPDLAPWQAIVLFGVNALAAALVLSGAAIDLEHMILPNEITFGVALICLASSPVRSVHFSGSLIGAGAGAILTYGPFYFYKKIKGLSGMGIGDAKLAIAAGAWHGLEGVIFVVFAAALQSVIAAVVMRVFRIEYDVPVSVRAEIDALRAKAAAGDKEAEAELADDPMAAAPGEGTMKMRLPLGPFLALACIEALFLRRHVLAIFDWLIRS